MVAILSEGADPQPYVETLLELLMPERVICGSDRPVLRLAGDDRAWLGRCLDIVLPEHHSAVFGANAIAFHRLDVPASGPS